MNLLDKERKKTRMLVHQPIPGYWYTSVIGQLQQVRMVLHEGLQQSRVVLENINGRRQTVSMEGWYRLDLTLHSPGNERRRRRGSGEESPGDS
ncbi:MAG: hypothetical protein ACE5FQ_12915 [Thiogranum sp.]